MTSNPPLAMRSHGTRQPVERLVAVLPAPETKLVVWVNAVFSSQIPVDLRPQFLQGVANMLFSLTNSSDPRSPASVWSGTVGTPRSTSSARPA